MTDDMMSSGGMMSGGTMSGGTYKWWYNYRWYEVVERQWWNDAGGTSREKSRKIAKKGRFFSGNENFLWYK